MRTEAGKVPGCFDADASVGASYDYSFAIKRGGGVGGCYPAVDEQAPDEIPADVDWRHGSSVVDEGDGVGLDVGSYINACFCAPSRSDWSVTG